MSLIENMKIDEKPEVLPFKIFEPALSSSIFMSSDSQSLCDSQSKINLTVGSPAVSSSLALDLTSPSMTGWSQDFNTFRGKSRTLPSELLLSSSSPTSTLFSSDLFQSRAASNPMRGFSGDDPNHPKRLHVSNIPFRYREHNLVMLFGKFGNVEAAEIIYNDKGSKGFGFVTMSRGQDADNAHRRLNHSIVEGRIIEVNLATPKISGFKRSRSPVGDILGFSSGSPGSSFTLASSKALVEAETKLAEAKLEVLQIRKQMHLQKCRVNF